MKLRYVGHATKTLVDVAVLEFGKVIEVSEALGTRLLAQYPQEYTRVQEGVKGEDRKQEDDKQARKQGAPPAPRLDETPQGGQEEVDPEVSADPGS